MVVINSKAPEQSAALSTKCSFPAKNAKGAQRVLVLRALEIFSTSNITSFFALLPLINFAFKILNENYNVDN